jgi:hypothetical protein
MKFPQNGKRKQVDKISVSQKQKAKKTNLLMKTKKMKKKLKLQDVEQELSNGLKTRQ